MSAIYTLPLYPFYHTIFHLSRGAFVSITLLFFFVAVRQSYTHGSYLLGVKSFNPFSFLARSFAHSLRLRVAYILFVNLSPWAFQTLSPNDCYPLPPLNKLSALLCKQMNFEIKFRLYFQAFLFLISLCLLCARWIMVYVNDNVATVALREIIFQHIFS